MSGNKVIKPVSFNITKTEECAMLKHVSRKNFSGYVKKLIMADLQAKMQQPEKEEVAQIHATPEKKEETKEEKFARLVAERKAAAAAKPLINPPKR